MDLHSTKDIRSPMRSTGTLQRKLCPPTGSRGTLHRNMRLLTRSTGTLHRNTFLHTGSSATPKRYISAHGQHCYSPQKYISAHAKAAPQSTLAHPPLDCSSTQFPQFPLTVGLSPPPSPQHAMMPVPMCSRSLWPIVQSTPGLEQPEARPQRPPHLAGRQDTGGRQGG